ncbi:hypothetical protein A2U01_0082707, partial [Trifolium medium]|nr:hypothetical protein [Trifolium medium]
INDRFGLRHEKVVVAAVVLMCLLNGEDGESDGVVLGEDDEMTVLYLVDAFCTLLFFTVGFIKRVRLVV